MKYTIQIGKEIKHNQLFDLINKIKNGELENIAVHNTNIEICNN